MMKAIRGVLTGLFATAALTASQVFGGTTWDGGGGSSAGWGNPANWDGDVLPAFDGTDDININSVSGSGTALTLDADRTILKLRSTEASPNFSIDGNVLTIQSGSIAKNNQASMTINSDIILQSDALFTITNASNVGIIVNGAIGETGGTKNVVVEAQLGHVKLYGANTYTGDTIVRRGNLDLAADHTAGNPGPFGTSTNPVLVGDTATGVNNWPVTLYLPSTIDTDRDITFVATGSTGNATLQINGAGNRTGTVTLGRDIHLGYGQPGNGTYAGLITGPGGITRVGGTELLTLSNLANDFAGDLTIDRGLIGFAINGTNSALGVATTTVTINSTGGAEARGLLAIGAGTFARDINITAGPDTIRYVQLGTQASSGDVVTYSGNIAMNTSDQVILAASNGTTADFTGILSGTSEIILGGHSNSNTGNRIGLSNPGNSFSGSINIGNGYLFVGADAPSGANGALGNSTAAVLLGTLTSGVNAPAIFIDGPYTVGRDIEVQDHPGYTGAMILGSSAAGDAEFAGTINNLRSLTSRRLDLSADINGQLIVSGTITGPGNVHIGKDTANTVSKGGDVILTDPANDFTGTLTVAHGRLLLAATGAEGNHPNPITVGTSSTFNYPAGVLTAGPATVTADVVLGQHINVQYDIEFGGATPDVSFFTGDIDLDRPRSFRANVFSAVAGGTVTFSGVISSDNNDVTLSKRGAGVVVLTAANTYSLNTRIEAGTLVAGHPQAFSTGGTITTFAGATFAVGAGVIYTRPVVFNSGATLGGDGTYDQSPLLTIASGRSIAPGIAGVGTLTIPHDLVMDSGAALVIELDAGQSDVLDVNGTVTLPDTLTISVLSTPSAESYVVVDNDGADPVSGSFSGLPEGADALTIGPVAYTISYVGGDGNDVQLDLDCSGLYSAFLDQLCADAGAPLATSTDEFLSDAVASAQAVVTAAGAPAACVAQLVQMLADSLPAGP